MAKPITVPVFEHMGIGGALERLRLKVPPNQREYSWEEDHVDDMFGDFAAAIRSNRSAHFMGTIVLISAEIPQLVDGQQRLATTTILLGAIRDFLHSTGEDLLCRSVDNLLFVVDREKRDIVARLELNTVDNEYFKRRILSKPDSNDRKIKATKVSHELIDAAANKAKALIDAIVAAEVGQKNKVNALNVWITFIEKHATVILATAPDNKNAYKMFETLNDRGLKTSQADLLKNYLFGEAEDRPTEAQANWTEMTTALEPLDIDDVVVTYLRHLACAVHGLTRSDEVYERLQERVEGRQAALQFLDQLARYAEDYAAILTSTDKKWNDYNARIRGHVIIMRTLGVIQIRPLMLAVAHVFPVGDLEKAFQCFVCWTVRFLIAGGGRGGALEEAYAKTAKKITDGEVENIASVFNELESIIPTDSEFEQAFTVARVSKSHLARYYLRAIEMQIREHDYPEVEPVQDATVVNLEHIQPQKPSADWPDADSSVAQRIGNQVLLNAKKNAKMGNVAFSEKVKIFKDSPILTTAEVAKQWGRRSSWGIDEINARQRQLAKLAVKTWPRAPRQ